MKIIYDEAKAILEKQQKDIEVPKQNKRAKIHNTIVVLIAAALLVGFSFAWNHIYPNGGFFDSPGGFILSMSIVGLICWLAKCAMKEIVHDFERYSANTLYYLEKGDKTVIDHELEYNSRAEGYMLWLTLEDENHIVSKALLFPCWLKSETRTDLTETIVDLEKSIVYMPYKP